MIEELGQMLLLTDVQLIIWYAAIKAYFIYTIKTNTANDINRFNLINKKKTQKGYQNLQINEKQFQEILIFSGLYLKKETIEYQKKQRE